MWRRMIGWKRKAVTSYCRLRGGKSIGKWWEEKIGHAEDATCPICGEEKETREHIVFWCMGINRLKDIRKRREWARESDLRWDRWVELMECFGISCTRIIRIVKKYLYYAFDLTIPQCVYTEYSQQL